MINQELVQRVSRLKAMRRDDIRLGASNPTRWLTEVKKLALAARKEAITEEHQWLCAQYHEMRKMIR